MRQQYKKAFTIIELLLAMSIVSLLLIGIATMTMQMVKIMNKGNTFRELNSAGRTINDDFTHEFNSLYSIDWDGGAATSPRNGAYYVKTSNAGAFCTGDVSYLWNNGFSLSRGRSEVRYAGTSSNSTEIRLVRVKDTAREYCQSTAKWGSVPRDSNTKNILPEGETGLMVYNIDFSTSAALKDTASSQTIINISYILGTKNDEGQINVSGMNCRPEAGDYCAVNKFDLTVRTLGRR